MINTKNISGATVFTKSKHVMLGTVLGLGMALAGSSAMASVISTATTNNTGFSVSGNDLLTGLTGTISGSVVSEEGLQTNTSGSALTDGGFGNVALTGDNSGMVLFHNGSSITYLLPTSSAGYTISSIDTFTGWRDTGRVEQDYTVSFAFASNPTNFINEFTVNADVTSGNDMKVSTANSTGAALGTNVVGIRFNFATTQNGYVGYRELDVIGAASVPEPASIFLLGLGALGLLATTRRKFLGKN